MGGFWRSSRGCTAACRSQIAELRREVIELRRQAHYYRKMHGKAVEREKRLKDELQAVRAKLKELRQRLRERWARRRGSEKRTRIFSRTEAAATEPRRRGQQPGAPGHGRRQHAHLPARVEAHDVDPERRRCPACGDEYRAHGSADSEQLEIEVRAYRRVIKRRRYRCSCQCAAAPALVTAPAPARLIPKGILGISLWVTVLIDKYLLYRPTYRLLADLRAHGLDLAQGTVTDGMRRLAPLFAPLREALIERSRTGEHWHADETSWQVFEASSEDALPPLVSVGVLECRGGRIHAGPDPFGTGAEGAFCDRDRRRGERRPLFIVQTDGQGHGAGAVVLLGICCGPDYDAERRYRRFRHQNPPCLRNITSFNHSAPRKAMSPLFSFHGRSGPGSAASQSASALAFISRSISA